MDQPIQAREFAISIVKKLHDAGYQALWAGGCVRDQWLGRQPKDYDVATNATPDQIRELFGSQRTLAIGAAFGVITVLGGKQAGQVEIATFRRDAAYSDGRHPDQVTFSSAEEDAQRRDFTINGLFHDPLTGQDIDYVNGRDDLRRKMIRAIGNPHERLAEDKLRMLRAVRFAATFDFAIEDEMFSALLEHASELTVVSAERITEEMRRMLVHPSRQTAVELLSVTGLLAVVLPEVAEFARHEGHPYQSQHWKMTLRILAAVDKPTFAVAFAILLRGLDQDADADLANICRRWRLSNEESSGVLSCLQHETLLRGAHRLKWPRVQRVLTSNRIDELLTYVAAISEVLDDAAVGLAFCRDKLALPTEQWIPEPLVTGDDLKAAGMLPGPGFRRILDDLRDAQLVGRLVDKAQALAEAKRLWNSRESP